MECTSQAYAAECTTRIARRILGVYQVGFTNGLGVFRFACGGRYLDTAAYTVCKRDTLMGYCALIVVVLFALLQMVKPMLQKKKTTIQVIEQIKQYYYDRYKKYGLEKMEPWK